MKALDRKEDNTKRIRISMSITEMTHSLLKKKAQEKGSNVSRLVSDMIWEDASSGLKADPEVRLAMDTYERLLQLAYEKHSSPEQLVSDFIWNSKVTYETLRGQMSFFGAYGILVIPAETNNLNISNHQF